MYISNWLDFLCGLKAREPRFVILRTSGMVLCTEDSAKIRGGGCNTPVLIPMN
jgi:hypothetical protein